MSIVVKGVLEEVVQERYRQVHDLGYTEESDDYKTRDDWWRLINDMSGILYDCLYEDSQHDFRDTAVKMAAVAVACAESIDRRRARGETIT